MIADSTERALPDIKKEFTLITDASEHSIGAILTQRDSTGKMNMI